MALTFSMEMLDLARLSMRRLGPVSDRIAGFALGCLNDDGGFRGRSPASDLYYTSFGIDCVLATGREVPAERIGGYLRRFGDGGGLNLIHLAALARCLRRIGQAGEPLRGEIVRNLECFRRSDGGYATVATDHRASAYGGFLACMAFQNLGLESPDIPAMLDCLASLRTPDGAYANEPAMAAGTATATAAAVVLAHRGGAADPAAVDWLLTRCRRDGGFLANPRAAGPDLLSTAAALYALWTAGAPLDELRQPCLDFVEGLWLDRGAFCGSPADPTPDCEYTFHGLLAVGCLL